MRDQFPIESLGKECVNFLFDMHLCTCMFTYNTACTMYMYIWLMLPSNQSFYRIIVGFGMCVADRVVG